jgi:hypothetical protein
MIRNAVDQQPKEQDSSERNLNHFLQLAERGRYSGASGGEARAFRLAEAIADFVPGLDPSATAGAIEFAKLASTKPMEARELVG